jgi:hypothetical protein
VFIEIELRSEISILAFQSPMPALAETRLS